MPERMITAVIPVRDSPIPLSVKTSIPVPKKLIDSVISSLIRIDVKRPVTMGQVILKNVLNTGADIVATRNLP